jgi:aryl-alcohol dehydrogenase-like predicted oxidoreductase
MERVTLGKTGLQVSPICLGTWQFGGDWGRIDRDEAKAAVRRALDLGVNFFDTAQAYGFGASEELLAEGLGDDIRRDDVIVATKGGLRPGPERDSSPNWVRLGIEESLRHLGVEAIDLYQLHWPDPDVPFDATGAALIEAVEAGKVRHVGVSNFSPEQIDELSRTIPVETLQPPYHLFNREVEESVLPYCREHDVGVLAYGPLAHGLLSGHFDRDSTLPDDDWRSGSPLFSGEAFERNLDVVERLRRFAEERGATLPQLAVAWVLANPAVHVAIAGARRPAHIEGVAGALELELSEDDLRAIDGIMESAVAAAGPSPEAT